MKILLVCSTSFYDRIDKNKPFYTEYELRLI